MNDCPKKTAANPENRSRNEPDGLGRAIRFFCGRGCFDPVSPWCHLHHGILIRTANWLAAPTSIKKEIYTPQYIDPKAIILEEFKKRTRQERSYCPDTSNTQPWICKSYRWGQEKYESTWSDLDNSEVLFIVRIINGKASMIRFENGLYRHHYGIYLQRVFLITISTHPVAYINHRSQLFDGIFRWGLIHFRIHKYGFLP